MMTVGWAWHGRYNLITDATVVGHGATRPAGNPITMTTTNILSMSDIMVTSLVTQNTALPIDAKQSSTLILYFSLRFLGKVALVRDNWWAIVSHFYRLCPIFFPLLHPLILCGGARDFSKRQGKYPCQQLLEHEHMRETNIWFVGLTRCGNK